MRIPVDHQSATPLYKQIEAFLRQGIVSGSLATNTRLPAVRELARDLGINRITVENAYAELESDNLIESRVGSGTYVLPSSALPHIPRSHPDAPWPLWQQEVQVSNETLARAQSNEALKAPNGQPGRIDFGSGIGDAHLFPADDFRKVLQTILRRDGSAALGYGDRRGYAPLRGTIAHILASSGIQVQPDNVLITAGSQQALALVAQLLVRPGDTILVESPTYSGAIDLFHALRFKVVGIPVDDAGMQVEALENLLQLHHPKLIYTIPNFQNPTGTCLSSARRHQLITLADRYNVPLLEDDFVGDLRYDGRVQPALKGLDPGGRVIYISTFSKMLMPGLRVGFLAAEGPVYDALLNFKRLNDLATSNLIQRALEAYVTVGRHQAHLRRSVLIYRKRRDAMLQAIHRHLPARVRANAPQGGLFIWLNLPEDLNAGDLLPLAHLEGVDFAPGSFFYPNPCDGSHALRLNFVTNPPEEIEEGMRRLGEAIRKLEAGQ